MPCVEDCYKQSENTVRLKMETIATGKNNYIKNDPTYQVR